MLLKNKIKKLLSTRLNVSFNLGEDFLGKGSLMILDSGPKASEVLLAQPLIQFYNGITELKSAHTGADSYLQTTCEVPEWQGCISAGIGLGVQESVLSIEFCCLAYVGKTVTSFTYRHLRGSFAEGFQ